MVTTSTISVAPTAPVYSSPPGATACGPTPVGPQGGKAPDLSLVSARAAQVWGFRVRHRLRSSTSGRPVGPSQITRIFQPYEIDSASSAIIACHCHVKLPPCPSSRSPNADSPLRYDRALTRLLIAASLPIAAMSAAGGSAHAYPAVCAGHGHQGSHTKVEVVTDIASCADQHQIIEVRGIFTDGEPRYGHMEAVGPRGHIGNSRTGWFGPGNIEGFQYYATQNGLYCIRFWEQVPWFFALDTNCVDVENF